MPFPRELTTPPVTKMYFVELTSSPPAVGRSTPLPRSGDPRSYPRLEPRAPHTAPRRSRRRAATGATAQAAPNAPPGRVPAAPSAPARPVYRRTRRRSEEHTSELQSRSDLVCRLLLEKKKQTQDPTTQKLHLNCETVLQPLAASVTPTEQRYGRHRSYDDETFLARTTGEHSHANVTHQ